MELGTMKELRRSGNPEWKDFFKPLPRPVSWAYFTWDDPLPFVRQTLRLFGRRFTKRLT
jgi:predicted ATP-grasp superfamily ATP-dependent carboligase